MRGSAEKLLARSRFEFGADVNGRVNVHATDLVQQYNVAGALTGEVFNVSIDNAQRMDAGVFGSIQSPVGQKVTIGAGLRGDHVTSTNTGRLLRRPRNVAHRRVGQPLGHLRVLGGRVGDGAVQQRLPRSDGLRPLLPRAHGARVHHRQPGPRAGAELPVRPGPPLHVAARPGWRLGLPLHHRQPDRALHDRDRLLLLPESRSRAHPGCRGGGERRAPAEPDARIDADVHRRRGARRWGGARRHPAADLRARAEAADRLARVCAAAGHLLRRRRRARARPRCGCPATRRSTPSRG